MHTLTARRGRPPAAVRLSAKDARVLNHWARSRKTEQSKALRAKIVLGAAEGQATAEIASGLGVSVDCVSLWRNRFARHGIEGLRDQPRSGRPRIFSPVQRLGMVGVACEPKPALDGLSAWTLDSLVDAIELRGIARVSRSQLHRILKSVELQPHRKRMWLHSNDPLFREKVTEIVQLYLNPPENCTVLSIDEKTGMQALERKYPSKPSAPGRVGRWEFEYTRHGTLSLFSAFNVQTGDLIGQCSKTRKADDLMAFMEHVASRVSGTVHVIWDNLNIHNGERWAHFNARHDNRFRFHYTPIHASWVNQVELWFGILQRRCLKGASFRSVEDLETAVEAFIRLWNEATKHPFRWSFLGYPAPKTEAK